MQSNKEKKNKLTSEDTETKLDLAEDSLHSDKQEALTIDKLKLFIKNDLMGGYSLAVRDNWGYKILRRHITEKEKEIYINDFGDSMLTDDEFFEWWCRINDLNTSDDKEDDFKKPTSSKKPQYDASEEYFF